MQYKLKQAVDLATSKHNILLTANPNDRQQFIQQLFKLLPPNIAYCLIDLANIKNKVDVIERFYEAITATFKQNTPNKAEPNLENQTLIKFIEFFTETNVPIQQQCATLLTTHGFRELIEYLLSALTTYCRTDAFSHVVVVINNFENITTIKRLKADAILRKISQENYHLSFIFAGNSKQINPLFHDYNQPLYGATTPINLKHQAI